MYRTYLALLVYLQHTVPSEHDFLVPGMLFCAVDAVSITSYISYCTSYIVLGNWHLPYRWDVVLCC